MVAKMARFCCCLFSLHSQSSTARDKAIACLCEFHLELDGWSGLLVPCRLLFLTHSSFRSPWGSWLKKKKKVPPCVAQNSVPDWKTVLLFGAVTGFRPITEGCLGFNYIFSFSEVAEMQKASFLPVVAIRTIFV